MTSLAKKTTQTLTCLGLVTTLVVTPFTATPAFAQTPAIQPQGAIAIEPITVVAIPPRLGEDNSLQLDPGETHQTSIQVRNVSDKTVDILTTTRDFIISSEDGKTPIPLELNQDVSNRWSLADWITLVPGVQTLKPNQLGNVTVLSEVPEDALAGGH